MAPFPADDLQGPTTWLGPAQQGYDVGHLSQSEPLDDDGMTPVLLDFHGLDWPMVVVPAPAASVGLWYV